MAFCIDDAESADRKRQRLNSEQDESQSTTNENENEQPDDPRIAILNSRRRLLLEYASRATSSPIAELETSQAESSEPATESSGKI